MRENEPASGGADESELPGIGHEDRGWQQNWLRVTIALVLAGQGMAFGLAANMTPPEGAAFWLLHAGLAVSALVVCGLLGLPLLRESLAGLRSGRITVDQLFLVTLAGSFAISVYSTIRGSGPVFYELVAILLAVYTVGKVVAARSRVKALSAVRDVKAAHAESVVVDPDGQRRIDRSEDVVAGQRVFISAGASVGVDGTICEGRGLVWTTPLTGEPAPVLKEPGDRLFAGMRSVDGAFLVETTAGGGERRLDSMLRSIEEARLQPSGLQRSADRLAARFVPLVILVSLATMVGWFLYSGIDAAIINGLAVLVVACPCALGLATPLGVWSGLVSLGRLGIVARTGEFIERLAGVDAALFDKTGTLCEPELRVASFEVLSSSPVPETRLRTLVSVAEHSVEHPVADVLRSLSESEGNVAATRECTLVEGRVVPGFGISAAVRDNATGSVHRVMIGADREVTTDDGSVSSLRHIVVSVDDVSAARVVLDEKASVSANRVFVDLQSLGISSRILTGDPHFKDSMWPEVHREVGMTPEEKAAVVEELQRDGRTVLFVGDGLNDAPALARADASLAIIHGTGADLARGNAMAVTHGAGLGTLPEAIRVARRIRKAIRSNLGFAAVYNTIGMGIAAAGWLHPVLAALLMAGSSALVAIRVTAGSGTRTVHTE